MVVLKIAHDENYKQHAVGCILLKEVLQDVFTQKLAPTIDFYTNATSDQLSWSNEQRSMFNASSYASAIFAFIVGGL